MVKLNLVSKLVGIVVTSALLGGCKQEPKIGYSSKCSQYVQKERKGFEEICSYYGGESDHILFGMIREDRDIKLRANDCNPTCEEWDCYKSPKGKFFMYITPKCNENER